MRGVIRLLSERLELLLVASCALGFVILAGLDLKF